MNEAASLELRLRRDFKGLDRMSQGAVDNRLKKPEKQLVSHMQTVTRIAETCWEGSKPLQAVDPPIF